MITLSVLIFMYLVAAIFWAIDWYHEYESQSGEYYAEERKTAARNFLLTPVGPILLVASSVGNGTKAMVRLIKDAFSRGDSA